MVQGGLEGAGLGGGVGGHDLDDHVVETAGDRLKGGIGAGGVAGVFERLGLDEMQGGVVPVGFQRPIQGRRRQGDVAGAHPGELSQIPMGVDHQGPPPQGFAIAGLGLVEPAQALARPRQHQPGLGRVEPLGERAAAAGLGLGIARHVAQGGGQIVLGDRTSGRDGDRPGVDLNGLANPPGRLQGVGFVGQGLEGVGRRHDPSGLLQRLGMTQPLNDIASSHCGESRIEDSSHG